jgi:hypothetical protein
MPRSCGGFGEGQSMIDLHEGVAELFEEAQEAGLKRWLVDEEGSFTRGLAIARWEASMDGEVDPEQLQAEADRLRELEERRAAERRRPKVQSERSRLAKRRATRKWQLARPQRIREYQKKNRIKLDIILKAARPKVVIEPLPNIAERPCPCGALWVLRAGCSCWVHIGKHCGRSIGEDHGEEKQTAERKR